MELREQLQSVETRLRDKRAELARARKIGEEAKASYAESQSETALKTASAATEGIKAVQGEIEAVQNEQVDLLKRLGDSEAQSRGGLSYHPTHGNGWDEVARRIDLANGVNTVDVTGGSLLRAQVPGAVAVGLRAQEAPSAAPPPASAVAGPYFAYQAFPRSDPAGAAAVTDFTISFEEPTVTGMERSVDATTDKPALPATYGLATPDVRGHAIIAEGIPEKLLEAPAFGPFLDTEMRRQVDLSVDRHVASQITAASPPSGSTGADLITRVRNAVAASRALGAWPSMLLLSSADSASLDLTQTGADNMWVFPLRDTGTSSPLWSLQVIESAAVTNPTLIDPGRAGTLYVGGGSVTVDHLSGLKTNVARIRVEIEGLLHVRNAQSIFVIA